jgi:hypothetical protein
MTKMLDCSTSPSSPSCHPLAAPSPPSRRPLTASRRPLSSPTRRPLVPSPPSRRPLTALSSSPHRPLVGPSSPSHRPLVALSSPPRRPLVGPSSPSRRPLVALSSPPRRPLVAPSSFWSSSPCRCTAFTLVDMHLPPLTLYSFLKSYTHSSLPSSPCRSAVHIAPSPHAAAPAHDVLEQAPSISLAQRRAPPLLFGSQGPASPSPTSECPSLATFVVSSPFNVVLPFRDH